MNPETPQSASENNFISQRDLDSARQLIEEDATLSTNPRVQTLLENDFVLEDGRQLDALNFLASMQNFLATAEASRTESMNEAIERNMVVHSLRPELENTEE